MNVIGFSREKRRLASITPVRLGSTCLLPVADTAIEPWLVAMSFSVGRSSLRPPAAGTAQRAVTTPPTRAQRCQQAGTAHVQCVTAGRGDGRENLGCWGNRTRVAAHAAQRPSLSRLPTIANEG